MKVTAKIEKEYDVNTMIVRAEVRYWEDSDLNGKEVSESGEEFPCKNGNLWNPVIDIDSGIITNWDMGNTANVHFKVCDLCGYAIIDTTGEIVIEKGWSYVPDILCPARDGYGDYIIMNIDEQGKIDGWKPELIKDCFEEED